MIARALVSREEGGITIRSSERLEELEVERAEQAVQLKLLKENMIQGSFGNVVLAPISELLARVLVQVTETVSAAKDVLIEQENFTELARYLEKLQPLLLQLQEKNLTDTPPIRTALQSLEREMKKSRLLVADCSSKSKIYLLINCRSIVKQVQDITHEIGRCLSLMPMTSMNLLVETREKARKLLQDMQNAQFKAAVADEEIVEKIENGIKTHRLDSNFSNELLLQIATAVGISVDSSSLRQELKQFKKEKEQIALDKDQAEAFQLEQIIGILSRADAATTTSEKGVVYRRKRSAGGNQPLPALQSFLCPITQEVMEDPVEIASGQTFERCAIKKWFASGNSRCPTTKVELESLEVKPNLALRQSIEEWKERNTIITIAAMRPRILSGIQREIQSALLDLLKLSEEKPLHKYWIASERLIPEIVKLLECNQRDTRKRALAALCSLAVNDENKEEIAAEGAITLTVRSLARDVGESRQAVALLLELSKMPKILDEMGKTQGCILLLVTMLRSEDTSAVEDARQLLMNLSNNDQNIVQMAEANYLVPMISRLNEGSDMTKILMASTLSRMSLTDESKITLARKGAIEPLVKMLSSGKLDYESAAIGALQILSAVPETRQHMIDADIIPSLLRILSSAVMALKEQASATLANIASWDVVTESEAACKYNVLLSEETLYQILTLTNLAGPTIQSHLLQALIAVCSKTKAVSVRNRLRGGRAAQLLIQFFCEVSNPEVKVNSLKLLFWLSGDGAGKELASHLTGVFIEALVKVISFSQDGEAKAAALGIVGNLPQRDAEVMTVLLKAEVLPAVANLISGELSRNTTVRVHNYLLENAASAFLLFTNPSSLDLQIQAASYGVIPSLVQLLVAGTALAKFRAAVALGQFSENSGKLSKPMLKSGGCWCFNPPPELGCKVHGGRCSVKTSFCLVEAGAIEPLVQALGDADAHEAALGALTTLLYDDTWENGVHVIANAQGIRPVVRLLTTGTTGAKEKAVWMLEKVFRLDKYKEEYGSTAQMPLIDLTQNGSPSTRQLAAKILAHLNILHNQSSYF